MTPRLAAIIAAVIAAFLASSSVASAQTASQPTPAPAASTDPLVEEIDIVAHLPGPALWRVSTPRSQIWILGLAGPVPKRSPWDTRRLESVLTGARELVMPPGASISVLDLMGLIFDPGHKVHLPPGQTVRDRLSPALRARFDAAARSVGQDPAHYDHWRPLIAALALIADADKKDDLNPEGMQHTVLDLAKQAHTPSRRLTNYTVGDMLGALGGVSPQAGDVCLSTAVSMVETLPDKSLAMAVEWQRGNVLGVEAIQASMGLDRCMAAAPGLTQIQDRVAKDWAKDLAQALTQPGKTVVAIDMDSLVRDGGLLDQLKAEGLDVIGPAYR